MTFQGAHPVFNVDAILTASNADFGNTARLGFALPVGTTFRSDSGVLLTKSDVTSGVPELGTWAMMIIGFGAVGWRVRRSEVHEHCISCS